MLIKYLEKLGVSAAIVGGSPNTSIIHMTGRLVRVHFYQEAAEMDHANPAVPHELLCRGIFTHRSTLEKAIVPDHDATFQISCMTGALIQRLQAPIHRSRLASMTRQ
jgi:hypothetical protein